MEIPAEALAEMPPGVYTAGGWVFQKGFEEDEEALALAEEEGASHLTKTFASAAALMASTTLF